MVIRKKDVKALIERAKQSLNEDDPSYLLLQSYIKAAEDMLPDIKGTLNSAQQEVYDRLEIAVGP